MAKAQMGKDSAKVQKEIEKLREEIRRHEYLYLVKDEPEISDAVFDKLMNRLKELDAAYPRRVTPDSPSVRVGGTPREFFQTGRHARPVLSLDNAFSYDALRDWDRRVREGAGWSALGISARHKVCGFSSFLCYG